MRKWQPGVSAGDFRQIAPAASIYRTRDELDPAQWNAFHTVVMCDLAKSEFDCESTAVLGPQGRAFYISRNSVFVWTSRWLPLERVNGWTVVRLPLDGSAPSELKVFGVPIDQFSFLEDDYGYLNVFVHVTRDLSAILGAETKPWDLALMRVPLSSFSDGSAAAPRESYRLLPKPVEASPHGRYVGSYLVYGATTFVRRPQKPIHSRAYAVRYQGGGPVHELPLPHSVGRIEALGSHAMMIAGSDGRDWHYTTIRLDSPPVVTDRYTRPLAAKREAHTGDLYSRQQGANDWLIGLPLIGKGEVMQVDSHYQSASVLYLRNASLRLSELGTLDSSAEAWNLNDGCRVGCSQWYGKSRPLFIGDRIFALLGYEIVEGRMSGGKIIETRRISFAPQSAVTRAQ